MHRITRMLLIPPRQGHLRSPRAESRMNDLGKRMLPEVVEQKKVESLTSRRYADRDPNAIRDEVRVAADGIDHDAAVREILDASLSEIRRLAVPVHRRAKVEQHRNCSHGERDEHATTTSHREHHVVVIRMVVRPRVVLVALVDRRMREEIGEAGGRVDVRAERAGGHRDLRSDTAERNVVGGGHVDRNTAAHEASADRLAPVLDEATFGANTEDTVAIEVPDEAAGQAIAGPDEVAEVSDRL